MNRGAALADIHAPAEFFLGSGYDANSRIVRNARLFSLLDSLHLNYLLSDLVLLNEDLSVHTTLVAGQVVYEQ